MALRRRVLLADAALLVLATSGCQVGIVAGVDAKADGHGTVQVGLSLDDDALAQVGDLKTQLRVGDLVRAGWTVTPPHKEPDRLTWVRATKPFSSPQQAAQAFDELSGPNGMFKAFRIDRHRSFLHTRLRFSGTFDLSKGAAASLSDPPLQQRLAASGNGDLDLLRRQAIVLDRVFKLEVVARLPGSIDSNAPVKTGGGVVWRPKVGDPPVQLVATSTSWNTVPVVLAGLGALVVVGALVGAAVLALRLLRR